MNKKVTYPKPKWAIQQIYRSGCVEDICKHGVGHPNRKWLDRVGFEHINGIHGCDGCCVGKGDHEGHQKAH